MKIETKIHKIINKAIPKSLMDRESLVIAYGGKDCEEISKEIEQIKSHVKLKFIDLNPKIVMLILIYAEQYEVGYANSIEKCRDLSAFYQKSLKEAKVYRDLRHKLFGKTKLEQYVENSKSYSLSEIINNNY